jgi:hypothetical protein
LQLIHRPATGPEVNGKASDDDKEKEKEKPSEGKDPHENPDEWGEFLHLPGQKFYDFNKIREEIAKDTELKTGKNAGKYLITLDLLLRWHLNHLL